jgi:phosphoribosylcarboxyaminoimidazole (NCAIR) mutase
MGKYHLRFSMGSKSDWKMGNVFMALMRKLGVLVHPSIASCHWSAGEEFTKFVSDIDENLIVIMGGMSLAAPGIAESTIRNLEDFEKLVVGIPLDKAAMSAIEDLPPGIPVFTCGFNEKDVTASITNAALAVARIIGRDDYKVRQKIADYYRAKRNEKEIVEEIELDDNGLIPDPSPKRVNQ